MTAPLQPGDSVLHRVPGYRIEVQLRRSGHRYLVRSLEIKGRPVKDDWRQVGTEWDFPTEAEARAHANQQWLGWRDRKTPSIYKD